MTGTASAGLPAAVATYLTTPKDQVAGILDQLFAADAVVHDEARTHLRLEAIRRGNESVAAGLHVHPPARRVGSLTSWES